MPFERRTRATLRRAEFGFFGVCVRTWVQTPRFCGEPFLPSTLRRRLECELKLKRKAGAPDFFDFGERPLRTSWLMVGIAAPLLGQIRCALNQDTGGGRLGPSRSGHENRPKSLFVNSAPIHLWIRAVFKHSASRPAQTQKVRQSISAD